jgi:EAL domain-containing protein (putative c-di-GMP-specific phosphodiesterase class I)/DNA-binding response OmpR family regulator
MYRAEVLIIEDDGVLREAYTLALGRAGFGVVEAPDAASAFRILSGPGRSTIGLVLLDMRLPDVDGAEVLAMIRRDHDDGSLPVIVLTAVDDAAHRLEIFAAGANDYVVKPVALSELAARVGTHFRTRDHWRGRLAAVSDSRQDMARTLATTSPTDTVSQAIDVVTTAAAAIPDVEGAAFLIDDGLVRVSAATGRIALTPETTWTRDASVEIRRAAMTGPHAWASSNGGSPGRSPLVVLPLLVDTEPVGYLALASAEGLSSERRQGLVAAGADLATLAEPVIGPVVRTGRVDHQRRCQIERVIAETAFHTVFQPIVELATGLTCGFEALTRFDDNTPPDVAFAASERVNMRVDLERVVALAAAAQTDHLPANAYLSINLSPESALDTALLTQLADIDRPVILEITEHDAVVDYRELLTALDPVRDRALIAVDDAGAGYAGLTHIRALRPDVVKLDRALVSDIDRDPVGRAMVAGLVHFSAETGSRLVGEGIETEAELATLLDLGVTHGQGYLLGRPTTIDKLQADSLALCLS